MPVLSLFLAAVTATTLALPPETAFLEGCWSGETGGAFLEERYGGLHGNVLLGHIKTVRDDEVRFFEFLRIYTDTEGTWLQPYPSGRQDAPRFRLIEIEPDKLVFENGEHDFPRRITYRLLPDGSLLTRVAGIVDDQTIVEEYMTLPRNCVEHDR